MTETATAVKNPLRTAWRQAIAPPPSLTVAEWTERHRVLTKGQSPRPGPWRNANAPYLEFLMNVTQAWGVIELNVCKATQMGVSEAFRNVLAYMAAIDPEPAGLALPSRDKGRKIVANRIIPMFQTTPIFKGRLTERSADLQAEQIRLNNGFLLHLMWSGSATSMASDPMRLAICDEVDKFEPWTGREADPVSLVRKRLRAYGDRGLQINLSSPTTRYGQIWTLVEDSDVLLYYFVPCPHCGTYHRLLWDNLKYDRGPSEKKTEQARYILDHNAVWFECPHCGERIDETHKDAMIRNGRWSTETGEIVDAFGTIHEHAEDVALWPTGTRIGVQISALYCVWESWANLAAEFVKAVGDLQKMYDFRTANLGEPFDDEIERTPASVFEAKSLDPTLPEGTIPGWAVKVLATIDTQHDHFFMVVRAWGPEMRSHRVWHGRVDSFPALDKLLLQPWKNERDDLPGLTIELALIDSGGTKLEGDQASRTSEVYRYVLPRKNIVKPIKGASKPHGGLYVWSGRGFVDAGTASTRRARRHRDKQQLRLWYLDTHHFADELMAAVQAGTAPDSGDERWFLSDRNDDEYNRHLSNATKVVVRTGSKLEERWIPINKGARVDYWDCEVYQIAAAYMAQVHALPADATLEPVAPPRRRKNPQSATDGRQTRSGGRDKWTAQRLRL